MFSNVNTMSNPDEGLASISELSRYYCSPEWHLAQLKNTPIAGTLYTFMCRIAKSTGIFHGSVVGLAQYFHVSRWKIQRALQALVKLGFLLVQDAEPFQPTVYRVISHQVWAEQHPDSCVVKESFPWSGEEGDELGVRLHNASGGRIKLIPYQMVALHNTGLTDDQIVEQFGVYLDEERAQCKSKGRQIRWRSVPIRFLLWLGTIGSIQ
jgi:hypothetical protein